MNSEYNFSYLTSITAPQDALEVEVWSVASLICIAAGCSAALRTCCLSNLACLTSVCSDLLHSWSLLCRRCSLAVTLFSRLRHNLSLSFSRFIGVELHSEESSVAFSWSIGVELDSEGFIMSTFHWTLKICILKSSYPFVQLKFTVYGLTYVLDTYTHVAIQSR